MTSKMKTTSKNEDDLKNDDVLKNEDNLKNENNLRNEDDPEFFLPPPLPLRNYLTFFVDDFSP